MNQSLALKTKGLALYGKKKKNLTPACIASLTCKKKKKKKDPK